MRTIAALLALLMLQACNAEADSIQFAALPTDWNGIYATPVDDYGVRCYRMGSELSCVQVRPSLPKPPVMEGQQNGG